MSRAWVPWAENRADQFNAFRFNYTTRDVPEENAVRITAGFDSEILMRTTTAMTAEICINPTLQGGYVDVGARVYGGGGLCEQPVNPPRTIEVDDYELFNSPNCVTAQ